MFRNSRQKQFAIAIFISFVTYGCNQALGDGAARIKGAILDERGNAYHDCRIDLITPVKGKVLDYRESLNSPFAITFVIPPAPDFYKLRVSCAASDVIFTSKKISLGDINTTYVTPVDLGTIVLKKR